MNSPADSSCAFWLVRLFADLGPETIHQFDRMDPDPTHLARHMTAQVGKVSVLGADDVAPVARSGVRVGLVLTLIADAGHNSRPGVLLRPHKAPGVEDQNEWQEEG